MNYIAAIVLTQKPFYRPIVIVAVHTVAFVVAGSSIISSIIMGIFFSASIESGTSALCICYCIYLLTAVIDYIYVGQAKSATSSSCHCKNAFAVSERAREPESRRE